MSLKLSPGCNCCVGVCEACSNTTFKNEYDVTLSGLSNGTLCDECEVLNGTFSLLTEGERIKGSSGWLYGWNQHALQLPLADAADAVAGATSACVWNYASGSYHPGCEYLDYPIEKEFWLEGLTLAKFKISDTSYVWRLIVVSTMTLWCSYLNASVQSGWYWETTSTTKDCHFDGTETWTAHTPSPSVSINCFGTPESLYRTDFCTGTLSLTSVVDG